MRGEWLLLRAVLWILLDATFGQVWRDRNRCPQGKEFRKGDCVCVEACYIDLEECSTSCLTSKQEIYCLNGKPESPIYGRPRECICQTEWRGPRCESCAGVSFRGICCAEDEVLKDGRCVREEERSTWDWDFILKHFIYTATIALIIGVVYGFVRLRNRGYLSRFSQQMSVRPMPAYLQAQASGFRPLPPESPPSSQASKDVSSRPPPASAYPTLVPVDANPALLSD